MLWKLSSFWYIPGGVLYLNPGKISFDFYSFVCQIFAISSHHYLIDISSSINIKTFFWDTSLRKFYIPGINQN